MSTAAFGKIAEGLNEALAVARGEAKPYRLHVPIETARETDDRWIAEAPSLPGVMAYGATEAEAVKNARALAERVIAERAAHGEPIP